MDWVQYATNVAIVASSWIVGILLARLIIRWFFRPNPEDGIALSGEGGTVSTDDVLEWDENEKPFIPVKIISEHGQYYAWFTGNNKFIGQSDKLMDVKIMARDHIFKQLGLRMTFDIDLNRGKKATAKASKSMKTASK